MSGRKAAAGGTDIDGLVMGRKAVAGIGDENCVIGNEFASGAVVGMRDEDVEQGLEKPAGGENCCTGGIGVCGEMLCWPNDCCGDN